MYCDTLLSIFLFFHSSILIKVASNSFNSTSFDFESSLKVLDILASFLNEERAILSFLLNAASLPLWTLTTAFSNVGVWIIAAFSLRHSALLCHLREMEFLLHDIKNKDLDIMTSYKCSINSLDKNLQQLIFFANNHYPRIREYFMRAFRMRDIKLFSKEFYYLCEVLNAYHKWHCWLQLGPSSAPRSESSKACL